MVQVNNFLNLDFELNQNLFNNLFLQFEKKADRHCHFVGDPN
jgi:hypothetical protein